MSKFEFKGYDWIELAECWGIYDPEDEDEVVAEKIKKYVLEHDTTEVAKDIRVYLRKLYEESWMIDYCYPVWKGMLEIENDETLIQFAMCFLEMMWS